MSCTPIVQSCWGLKTTSHFKSLPPYDEPWGRFFTSSTLSKYSSGNFPPKMFCSTTENTAKKGFSLSKMWPRWIKKLTRTQIQIKCPFSLSLPFINLTTGISQFAATKKCPLPTPHQFKIHKIYLYSANELAVQNCYTDSNSWVIQAFHCTSHKKPFSPVLGFVCKSAAKDQGRGAMPCSEVIMCHQTFQSESFKIYTRKELIRSNINCFLLNKCRRTRSAFIM